MKNERLETGRHARGRLLALWVVVLSLSVGLGCAGRARGQGAADVRAFVHQTFIHGVPYAQASRFTSADATTLMTMLEDAQEAAYWSNIVVTLCIIGDERAVDPVISFFSRDVPGALSASEYNAKTGALMSLGYIVNKSGNLKALNYLIGGLNPDTWTARKLNWVSPYQAGEAERNRQLTATAIAGLALSGHPLARTALVSLQNLTGAAASNPALVEEALRAHAVIASEGLAAYYRKSGL